MTAGTEITIWHIALPDKPPGQGAWALLDEREQERAKRFIHDRDRYRFVAAHAGLRLALAAETGQPPRALQFETIARGKPVLKRNALAFNLSHSGDRGVVATCRDGSIDIGIDIEAAGRLRDLDGLADMVMTEDERAAFAGLPENQRKPAFLRLWTRKEALLKADGRGLMHDPRKVEVGLDAEETRSVPFDGRSWSLRAFTPAPGYGGTVCIDGPLGPIHQRQIVPPR